MPQIIDYPAVVAQAAAQHLVSLYPNSGAFGFAAGVPTSTVGWVIGDDPTIRPAARALTVVAPTPTPAGLARLAEGAWRELLADDPPPGRFPAAAAPAAATAADVWVLPKAHWAYELDFGGPGWMPDLLRRVGVDPDALASRHDGSAVAFAPATADADDPPAFVTLVEGLLTHLLGSDFQLLFPGRDLLCTVHHHKQLWWTSPDANLVDRLRGLVG